VAIAVSRTIGVIRKWRPVNHLRKSQMVQIVAVAVASRYEWGWQRYCRCGLKPSLEAAVLGAGPHAGLSGFDATEDQLEASDNE
jgi:hypothetical protein